MSAATEAPDLAARLAETATRTPDAVALIWQDQTVTYRELNDRASAAAGGLQSLGVAPGDRVAIMVGNTPHFVEAHFGALRAGAAVVPLNIGLTSYEVEHVLRDSGARVCVVTGSVAGVVTAVRDRVDTLEHVIVAAASADVPEEQTWRHLLAANLPVVDPKRSPDDLAALVYTSGTTGLPKGAMLTRTNLSANQDQSLSGRLSVEATDRVLLVLPLFHIYALNVGLGASVRVGATMVLVERFDPNGTLELIEQHRISVILGAPPMYVAWLHTPGARERDWSGVRIAVSGSAPLPAHVLDEFEDRMGVTIWEGYGLTEASPSVTSNARAERPRPGSVGLPLDGLEVQIVDDAGELVAAGDTGELLVRGPNVFTGYWNDAEATAATLTDDGWLRTGDVATIDDDGFIFLVDRKRDLILVSGFNVYPREVEDAIHAHPGVAHCAVVGVEHPYTGEAVKAYVVANPDTEVTEDEIALFCRTRLARYKCPETVEMVASLPQTATGKIRRAALRGA